MPMRKGMGEPLVIVAAVVLVAVWYGLGLLTGVFLLEKLRKRS
jgi:hypothetical protein